MIKKTITYTDFNGDTRTEDFYFNLTNSELLRLKNRIPAWSDDVDLSRVTADTVKDSDLESMVESFETFILSSYGEKSEDGKRFVKSDEITTGFMQSAAYEALFEEFINDPNSFSNFLIGIVPKSIADTMKDK